MIVDRKQNMKNIRNAPIFLPQTTLFHQCLIFKKSSNMLPGPNLLDVTSRDPSVYEMKWWGRRVFPSTPHALSTLLFLVSDLPPSGTTRFKWRWSAGESITSPANVRNYLLYDYHWHSILILIFMSPILLYPNWGIETGFWPSVPSLRCPSPSLFRLFLTPMPLHQSMPLLTTGFKLLESE